MALECILWPVGKRYHRDGWGLKEKRSDGEIEEQLWAGLGYIGGDEISVEPDRVWDGMLRSGRGSGGRSKGRGERLGVEGGAERGGVPQLTTDKGRHLWVAAHAVQVVYVK